VSYSSTDKTEVQLFREKGKLAHVEDDLVLEEVRVLLDGVSVGECSDGVLEHLLVDTWTRQRRKGAKKRRKQNVQRGLLRNLSCRSSIGESS
jgi:hypothetical protein